MIKSYISLKMITYYEIIISDITQKIFTIFSFLQNIINIYSEHLKKINNIDMIS